MKHPLTPVLPARAEETIHRFLRAQLEEPSTAGFVVALSGGIDSALAARLARDAVGPERILGVLLPDAAYSPALQEETERYAASLGIRSRVIGIAEPEAALRALLPEVQDRVTWGNVKARLRMVMLYVLARELGYQVLGTGNKSEILVGYFTKYGDGGADLHPLGDLYKTQLRELARNLGLPQAILDREPTAGFWEGQTDEGELGLSYTDLDRILVGLERLYTEVEIVERTELPTDTVRRVIERVAANRHKRRLPPIPKLSLRTVGVDWRD